MTHINRRQALGLAAAAATLPVLATRAQAATTHTVRITNFEFVPANLTIAAGDSVTFINEDSAPHTATADSGAFDTGRLRQGQSATLTFNGGGSFPYFCAVHPRMRGSLSVG